MYLGFAIFTIVADAVMVGTRPKFALMYLLIQISQPYRPLGRYLDSLIMGPFVLVSYRKLTETSSLAMSVSR